MTRPDPNIDPEGFVEWEQEQIRNAPTTGLVKQAQKRGVYSFLSDIAGSKGLDVSDEALLFVVMIKNYISSNASWPKIIEEIEAALDRALETTLSPYDKFLRKRHHPDSVDKMVERKHVAFHPLTANRILTYELDATAEMDRTRFDEWANEYYGSKQERAERANYEGKTQARKAEITAEDIERHKRKHTPQYLDKVGQAIAQANDEEGNFSFSKFRAILSQMNEE